LPTVFAETRNCAVKIAKRGKYWSVYRLENVKCKKVERSTYTHKTKTSGCKFNWQKRPTESFHYPPFEKKDVYNKPEPLIDHIVKMCRVKLSQK